MTNISHIRECIRERKGEGVGKEVEVIMIRTTKICETLKIKYLKMFLNFEIINNLENVQGNDSKERVL